MNRLSKPGGLVMKKAVTDGKAKTAVDARVMAWWDYGYQITGIANRT